MIDLYNIKSKSHYYNGEWNFCPELSIYKTQQKILGCDNIYNDNIADVLENRIKTGLIYLSHNWEI